MRAQISALEQIGSDIAQSRLIRDVRIDKYLGDILFIAEFRKCQRLFYKDGSYEQPVNIILQDFL